MTRDVPTVDDVLTLGDLDAPGLQSLTSPVLLVALTGWFDAAGVATTALDHLTQAAVTIGEIDPDPFYDFTQERPTIEIEGGDVRSIMWPANTFRVVRTGDAHDLVVLSGVEPHLAWPTFAGCALRIVDRMRCEAVVTVGATADPVPHTRMPLVVGSSASPGLARKLGLAAPTYQGITGLIGVLHADLERIEVPTISLRVGVPHYLTHAEHPRAVAALLRHLSHVLGLTVRVDLRESIARWSTLHDEAVAEDDRLRAYVSMLEADYDRQADETLSAADDLATRFEEFLREERGDSGSDETEDH
jgi:predicted ATP-grasp superfamily ATP-dependent carboligase